MPLCCCGLTWLIMVLPPSPPPLWWLPSCVEKLLSLQIYATALSLYLREPWTPIYHHQNSRFAASRHPAVLRGHATVEEVQQELLDTFFSAGGGEGGVRCVFPRLTISACLVPETLDLVLLLLLLFLTLALKSNISLGARGVCVFCFSSHLFGRPSTCFGVLLVSMWCTCCGAYSLYNETYPPGTHRRGYSLLRLFI